MNIIEEITKHVGGGTVGKLSSYLGESPENTRKGVGAAVPTLLAGLTQSASTPEGAQRLSAAAADNDGLLDSFGKADNDAVFAKGGSSLQSLLGTGMASNMGSVLGRFTGMKGNSATGVMNMLAPLILGVLGRHQRTAGLNASGLASFLGGQKNNIASAMPSGLSSMLGGIPGFGAFGKAKAEASEKFEQVVDETKSSYAGKPPRQTFEQERYATPVHGHEREHAGAGKGKWALGLVAALAILGIFWAVTNRRGADREMASTRPAITEPAGAARPEASTVTTELQDTLSKANSTVSGITDAASAEKALPQLNKLNSQFADMQVGWNKLPEATRSSASTSMQPTVNKLGSSIAKAQNIPGLSENARSALSQLYKHASSFTSTAASP